ncbi:MAG: hypothetical protein ABIE03_05230 [Patescibacteria group bacterium]|nr:hypothetical protein [Patescibacteria group bacterium]
MEQDLKPVVLGTPEKGGLITARFVFMEETQTFGLTHEVQIGSLENFRAIQDADTILLEDLTAAQFAAVSDAYETMQNIEVTADQTKRNLQTRIMAMANEAIEKT